MLDSREMQKAHALLLPSLTDPLYKSEVKTDPYFNSKLDTSTCLQRNKGQVDATDEGGRRGSVDTESEEEEEEEEEEDTMMRNSHAYFNLDGANDAEGVRMQDMPTTAMPQMDPLVAATSSTAATAADGKPFVCEICHAKFARASHLCRHRRTHTGEKPFECKKCGKLFSRQDKLKTHNDRHLANEGGTPIVIPRKKKKDKLKGQQSTSNLVLAKQPTQLQQQIPHAQLLATTNALAATSASTPPPPPPWNGVAFPGLASPLFAAQLQQLQAQAPSPSAIQLSSLVATLMANQRNQGQ